MTEPQRRLAVGAELMPEGGVVRVWAPRCHKAKESRRPRKAEDV